MWENSDSTDLAASRALRTPASTSPRDKWAIAGLAQLGLGHASRFAVHLLVLFRKFRVWASAGVGRVHPGLLQVRGMDRMSELLQERRFEFALFDAVEEVAGDVEPQQLGGRQLRRTEMLDFILRRVLR